MTLPGTPITIDSNGSRMVVRGAGVVYVFDQEPFSRVEFSHDKLQAAKNVDGSRPQPIQLLGGRVAQFITNCGSNQTVRPYTPDDSVIASIMRRWDIRRYVVTGDVSVDQKATNLQRLGVVGKSAITRFTARQAKIGGSDLSYSYLVSAQSDTFSYITTSTLRMYGPAIGSIGTMSSASMGGTSIVTTNAGLYDVGQKLIIEADTGSEEIVTISAINYGTNTLTVGALAHDHSTGAVLQLYEDNLLVTDFRPEVSREFKLDNGSTVVRKTWQATIEHRSNVQAEA